MIKNWHNKVFPVYELEETVRPNPVPANNLERSKTQIPLMRLRNYKCNEWGRRQHSNWICHITGNLNGSLLGCIEECECWRIERSVTLVPKTINGARRKHFAEAVELLDFGLGITVAALRQSEIQDEMSYWGKQMHPSHPRHHASEGLRRDCHNQPLW